MYSFKVFLFLLLLGSFSSYAQYTETINSNRPGNSQGAFSVGTGVLQLETGGMIGRDEHVLLKTESDLWGIEYSLRYGFFMEQLEVNLSGSFLSQSTSYTRGATQDSYSLSNFDANAIGVKYLVYDPYKIPKEKKPNLYSWKQDTSFEWSELIPAVSVYAGANFSFGDNPYIYEGEGNISPRLAVITQNNWGAWVLVLNLIADKLGQEYPSYIGMATLTHSFNQKFAVFGEFQEIISDLYSDEILRGGLAYLFHKNFQADISALVNFKDTPTRWQVAAGISYRLDMHKQDQYIEIPED